LARRLIEEADQSFEVLCSSGQEKLLADKLHPTQAQTSQSDLVLELGEQCFDFPAFVLRVIECRSFR
jgi:hypothetical protein